jgi:hypothetical protein
MSAHKFKWLLVLLLLQSTSFLPAQSDLLTAARAKRNDGQAKEQPGTEWYNPTHASLTFQVEGATESWTYEISGGQDLRITANAQGKDGQHETSEIMFISGKCQWMLARNAQLAKGYEIDALDSAVLTLKLVTELLQAAVPSGPRQITKSTTLNFHEDTRPIHINTASASGGLEAPWTLQGTIQPVAADEWSFDLTATHNQPPLHVTGTWQKAAVAPVFADDMSLAGWQIFSVGPIKRVAQNSTILDYGAQPSRQQPKTLGELRKLESK